MKRIISATVLCFLTTSSALACSMAVMPERPRSMVHAGTYIMVGQVIGYTEPVTDPNNFRGEAIGLKIKPVETINFPYFQNDYVELFMFSHGSDCFPEARGSRPALGTKYKFALQPARLVASMRGSHVRLESRVFDRIAVDEEMFGYSTTATSVFDYKNDLLPLAKRFKSPEMMNKRQWLSDFVYMETSKDLLRFQKARTEKERMEILGRLVYCPDINYERLLYSEVGKSLPTEETQILQLLPETVREADKKPARKLSKDESRLLNERNRLEASGSLNIWK